MGARSSQSRGPGLNETDGHLLEYFRNTFGAGGGGNSGPTTSTGLTATGGVISDYTSGTDVYRAHVFTSSGTFDVTAGGSFGDTVDVLATGAGGGGGSSGGGGGGGGVRYLTSQPVGATFPQPFAITIGAGGNGASPGPPFSTGTTGNSSSIGSSPQPINITSPGGGGGGGHSTAGAPGASSGGTGRDVATAGTSATGSNHPGVSNADVPSAPLPAPAAWFGHAGGQGPSAADADQSGGGGGGAGAVGNRAYENSNGAGGAGAIYTIANGTNAKYGAGGGGGRMTAPAGVGGASGYSPFDNGGGDGGTNPPAVQATSGDSSFGQGGGGGYGPGGPGAGGGGSGGSGTVIVRYQIGSINTPGIKATGGAISFAGSKTVHVFTSSGTFTVTNGPITCDYLVVGGGASGGLGCGGGGGAGGYRTSLPEGPGGPSPSAEPTQAIANGPYAVQVGGGGVIAGNGSRLQTFGGAGTFSNIAFPSAIRAEGGGGGGNVGGSGQPGKPGGSGGGGTYPNGSPAPGNKQSPHSGTPAPNQGYAGGTTNQPANYGAGGGGGAGGAGANGTTSDGGDGGTGKQNTVTGVTLSLAGGGGGNLYYPGSTVGDATHGGGQGAPHAGVAPESGPTSIHGHSSTGGGGGGGLRGNGPGPSTGIPPGLPGSVIAIAGQGGSGIVIIAYPT